MFGGIMVKEYLEKTRESFMNRRAVLMDQLTSVENLYKENLKMIQLLENSNDPTFEEFSPREVNTYNRSKQKELEEEQKSIDDKANKLRNVISEMDMKILEINSVLKVANEDSNAANVDIQQLQDSSKDLNLVLLETVEAERQRIARDLHDTTVQSLTSLVHKSELCSKLIDVDPIRCKLELMSMSKILRDVINESRRMIYDLRPMSFDDIGFDVTVERSLDKFSAANNIRCIFNVEGEPFEIRSIVAITLLRVVQESCSNSVKHGHASCIYVTLEYLEDELALTIRDDGEGFDISSIPECTRKDNSGFGLSMMRERVYLLSGKLVIESSKGNGCITKVNLPIKKEDN